ncbi:MAG: hypothetical protein OHK0015_54900 [Chloroflexi bacterium OHK40]
MAAELHALRGQLVGLRLELGDETVTIGRDPGNQVILTSKRVGRRHAELRCEGAQYLLLDLNSRNGTFVNGERVTEPRLLRVGDQIAIADELFTLVEVAAPIAVLEVVAGELAGRSYDRTYAVGLSSGGQARSGAGGASPARITASCHRSLTAPTGSFAE